MRLTPIVITDSFLSGAEVDERRDGSSRNAGRAPGFRPCAYATWGVMMRAPLFHGIVDKSAAGLPAPAQAGYRMRREGRETAQKKTAGADIPIAMSPHGCRSGKEDGRRRRLAARSGESLGRIDRNLQGGERMQWTTKRIATSTRAWKW